MDRLLMLFNSIVPVSEPLRAQLSETLKTLVCPKKHYILKEGQISSHIYFIERGFVRSFYSKDGKEITCWFMKENDIIISVNSFYKRTPSYESIQSLEECVLHYIHYQELQHLYKEFVEFNIIGRILTENYYILSEERLFSMRKQSAEDRFRHLLQNHPEVIQRARLTDIASYLGISLETLSRIRGKW